MATKQPEWEFIGNLGDRHPLDYGGYFIFRDKTGVYPEEAELLEPDEHGQAPTYTVWRFPLERWKVVSGYLIPFEHDRTWPHMIMRYDAWFHEHLDKVANYVGSTKEEMEAAFSSEDPLLRAEAYRALGDYFGWNELDQDPERELTRKEVENRYKEELEAMRR